MKTEAGVKAQVQAHAKSLGFDECRITSGATPASGNHFKNWLKAGCHGQMGYLERNAEKRLDPTRVLPGLQSIVTLATSYFRKGPPSNPTKRDSPHGIVARYARYDDYHDILAEKLKELTGTLTKGVNYPSRSLWYVDTGPLLERDIAQRAGIGFIGKHTNLISRRLGNWIFLSEILTTIPLPVDPPEKNRCGSCQRCLDACPSKAILKPFELDARRCISYLTIELKGSIPIELRPLIGDRIFGCDDCLEVCPWNRFAREGRIMNDHSQPMQGSVDLEEWAQLDEPTFRQRFRGTPFFRTKWKGLMRNICVALGNIGDEQNLPTLKRLSANPEPLVAEHARWAIEAIRRRATDSQQAQGTDRCHRTDHPASPGETG